MSVVTTTSSSLSGRDIPNLESLYEAANGVNFTPGWVPRKKPILWSEPRPEYVPAHWGYEDAKAGLDVVIQMEADLLRVEGLGRVDVRHRNADHLELQIHDLPFPVDSRDRRVDPCRSASPRDGRGSRRSL